MSVIVKGMKMPDSCAVCRFAGKGGYHMERVVCMFTGKNEDAVKVDRLPDCPLVELPDKHGRLVDADALIDDLKHDVAYLSRLPILRSMRTALYLCRDGKQVSGG